MVIALRLYAEARAQTYINQLRRRASLKQGKALTTGWVRGLFGVGFRQESTMKDNRELNSRN